MKDRRINKRVALRPTVKSGTVKYGLDKPPSIFTTFVTDLSETGICIEANTIFKPGTKIYLTVFINESSFDAEGVVAWAKKPQPGIISVVKNGMGIEFTSVDKGLLDICKEKS